MAKSLRRPPRPSRPARAAEPATPAPPTVDVKAAVADRTSRATPRETVCRSCGVRPGRPTAIIGQLTSTELCEVCAALRKERIRQNRAMQRSYRI